MALDHSELYLENKFLENKSGRIFCLRQVYFTKSCKRNPGMCKPTFYTFLHITSKVKQYYLPYTPRTECSISQFFKTNCSQSIFRTINCRLLVKPLNKISKITHTASQFSLLTSAKFAVNINRVML